MNPPATKTAQIVLTGKPEDYADQLDPQNWEKNAGVLWKQSFIVGDTESVRPSKTMLLLSRRQDPTRATPKQGTWANCIFFEDLLVLDGHYRNILLTSFEKHQDQNGSLQSLEFTYSQLDCLDTETILGRVDGGIDVDTGGAICRKSGANEVTIEFSKTIRFTEPAALEDDISDLNKVLLPLILDTWLHLLVYTPRK